MLDIKTFKSALEQLEEERKIPKEKILDAIEQAMAAAYKKDYGKKGQIIRAKFDLETGKTDFYQIKIVVDETIAIMDGPLPRLPLAKGEEKGGGRYSRAYLSHLFHGKEMLAATLASIHNLYFIVNLVKKIRQSILNDTFFEYKKEFLQNYKSSQYRDDALFELGNTYVTENNTASAIQTYDQLLTEFKKNGSFPGTNCFF